MTPSGLRGICGGWSFAALSCFLGCSSPPSHSAPRAEIGVFYGGQVQRLEQIEYSTVRAPKLGFRVWAEHSKNNHSPRSVTYQLVRPGPVGRRVTKEKTLTLAENQDKLDCLFDLPDDVRFGLWNVRIVVDGRLVADRALRIVSAR